MSNPLKHICMRLQSNFLRVFFLVSLLSPSAWAADNYQDWAIACDNTRRCEAVGYQAENADTAPVLLHLTRQAGPGAPVHATFSAIADNEPSKQALTLRVNKLVLRGIKVDQRLTQEQTKRLLPALLDASTAELSDGKLTWVLSLAGIKAALLKMDEKQGRIGTPGALVRKGSKPESSVLPSLPIPLIKAAPLAPERQGDDKLLAPILKAIKQRDAECWDATPDKEQPYVDLTRLTDKKVLVMRLCHRAAYQVSYAAWIANDKPPYQPQRVMFPYSPDEPEDYVMNADFDRGIMYSYSKGRGLFDCGSRMSWVWTADGFKLLEHEFGPLCRGFGGGGQMLRIWIADIRH